jgi:alanyl-tRNA synthetase
MKSREIRQTFIDYFKRHGHRPVASSPLVPENDATLLFANAGMNQFKNLFLGLEHRGYTRAVTSQKCVRAGGKHNDLENVGHTARHHTFFEMLGNFSFGDYFKKDAIHFAWELLTKELGLPKDKFFVTVFLDDDEAADIWHKQEGVPKNRIYRFGEKDNFWRMGDTGPCGPCSEIFYDHGPEADDPDYPSTMGGDGDRYVEIWNNVFMQFNEADTGRSPLPKPSVDTGGGLERWAAMLQGKPNNYDTDLFQPIIGKAAEISKKDYVSDLPTLRKNKELREGVAAMRVVADHSRATAFLIADGVMPSNEGRGYVLRRIMRRAIRHGRTLTDDPSLFVQTIGVVIQEMCGVYPELTFVRELITNTVTDEISRFLTTLDQGTVILNDELNKLSGRGNKTVGGDVVFKLYDTFGFPVDLTRLMAVEKGFVIDETGFAKNMDAARETSKASSKFKALSADAAHLVKLSQSARDQSGVTKFLGYTGTEAQGTLLQMSNGFEDKKELRNGDQGLMLFDQTPFYGESGGQAGDQGELRSSDGSRAEIFDCSKQNDVFLHHARVIEGTLRLGDVCTLHVTDSRRRATAANHSATHLLHAALRKVLGTHVTQAGSAVDAERLRFDYTHSKALSESEITRIEDLVNAEISRQIDVVTNEMDPQAAIAAGAMALFGEKYGDSVRVVKMGNFSTELCGGTHVTNTSMIRIFKLVSETGVSAGVRRIEGITADTALSFLQRNTYENQKTRLAAGYQESWNQYLHPSPETKITTVTDWIENAKTQIKSMEREIKALKGSSIDLDSIVRSAKAFTAGGIHGKWITATLDLEDRQVLSELADKLKDRIQTGAVAIVGRGSDGKHPIIVTVSKNLTKALSAGKILSEIAQEMKGKGGGRPDFAQGAGEDLTRVEAAFAKAAALFGIK